MDVISRSIPYEMVRRTMQMTQPGLFPRASSERTVEGVSYP